MPIPSPQHEITSWLYCLWGEDHRRKQPRKQPWIPVHALTSWHLHIPILQKYCSFSCWEHYRWFNHWSRWSPEGKYSRLTVVHLKTSLKETTYIGLRMWHRPRKSWQRGEKPPECVDGPASGCELQGKNQPPADPTGRDFRDRHPLSSLFSLHWKSSRIQETRQCGWKLCRSASWGLNGMKSGSYKGRGMWSMSSPTNINEH